MGKPMIAYTIDALQQCDFVDSIFVSSDDEKILRVGREYGATELSRPAELATDDVPKIIAVRQAVQDPLVEIGGEVDIVIVAQANSPEMTVDGITRGYNMLLNFDLWEVMSADENGVQNGAFRILKKNAIYQEHLSAHCGFVVANNLDVHSLEDVRKFETERDKWIDSYAENP